jgi:hypothetical protein
LRLRRHAGQHGEGGKKRQENDNGKSTYRALSRLRLLPPVDLLDQVSQPARGGQALSMFRFAKQALLPRADYD